MPKGFEAIVAPRSGTYKNYGIMQANSLEIIDNSYSGDEDEWMFPALPFVNTTVNEDCGSCSYRGICRRRFTIQ